MKTSLLFGLLLALRLSAQAQVLKDWVPVNPPRGGIIGQQVVNHHLVGDPLPNSSILTQPGPTTYFEEAKRSLALSFQGQGLTGQRKVNLDIDSLVIDQLAESVMSNNSRYFNGEFVYKALRAKSVTYYINTATSANVTPTQLLPAQYKAAIKAAIPNADSLQVRIKSNDTIAVTVKNPRVYFRAQVVQLKLQNCKDCREVFSTHSASGDDLLDISDVKHSFADVVLPYPTYNAGPTFRLSLDQDTAEPTALQLLLSVPSEIVRANPPLTSPVVVPAKVNLHATPPLRTYGFDEAEHYLGIYPTPNGLLQVYIGVMAMQNSPHSVQLLQEQGGKLITKLEYTPYRFVYSRKPLK